jgi:hypothetical protein
MIERLANESPDHGAARAILAHSSTSTITVNWGQESQRLLYANAQAFAQYREWFQAGFSQAVAHCFTFDEGTKPASENVRHRGPPGRLRPRVSLPPISSVPGTSASRRLEAGH